MVSVNNWTAPSYRSAAADGVSLDVVDEFFTILFPRENEQIKFLDWLAQSLQNEEDKPMWAPFPYSDIKGSGESTLCQLVARLIGTENTVT